MRAKQIRELRRQLIYDLDLDKSATTEEVCLRLCQVMANRMRREIRLKFDDLGAEVTGLWAVTRDGVHIVIVTTSRSWMHRLVILLHEIAHMLCGHEPVSLTDKETSRVLYHDLWPEMLDIIASRTTMTQKNEAEADMVAGAVALGLIRWAGQKDVRPFKPDEETAAVSRKWYSLGYSPSRGVG
jgi:hypothetical protein